MIVNFRPKGTPVVLTAEERRTLLEESIAVPPELLQRIESAPEEGGSVRVWLELDDLELLVDGLSADANHAKTRRMERFYDGLYERFAEVFVKACKAEFGDESPPLVALAETLLDTLEEEQGDAPDASETAAGARAPRLEALPCDELGGLSPDQALSFAQNGWWEEPYPVRLAPALPYESVSGSRLLRNARIFLRAASSAKGAPATAAGNLNRAFVGEMLEALDLPQGHREAIREINKVVNEDDVLELHIVRVVCQVGGLLRKDKKRFVATRKAEAVLGEEKAGALYRHLFDAVFRKFNLAYLCSLPDSPGVHATAPYVLFRIASLETGKPYAVEGLAEAFFLPLVLEEIEAASQFPEAPRWCLQNRILRPLEWLGLVEILPGEVGTRHDPSLARFRKLPLFDEFLSFEP